MMPMISPALLPGVLGGFSSGVLQDFFLFFHQFLHLFDEICLYFGQFKDFVYGSTLTKCFIHQEVTLT